MAVPVRVEAVAPASLTLEASATGVLEARDDVVISTEVGGQVEETLVRVGDRVYQDEVLLTLDDELASLGVRQAEAQLLMAEAELDDAETNLSRSASLWESEDISDVQYEAAQTREKAARASYMAAEAALGSAERQLRNTRVRSPIDGVVAFVHVEEGQLVAVGTPVAHVVNDDVLQVELGLSEDRVSDIVPGARADVRVRALGGRTFRGKVEYVGPRADDMTKTYPVRVMVPNSGHAIRAGMVAEVSVAAVEFNDVIAIQSDWVVDRYGEPAAFVASDSTAALRRLSLGRAVGDKVVVNSGLQEGDLLITLGAEQLTDGAPIEIRGDSPEVDEEPADVGAEAGSDGGSDAGANTGSDDGTDTGASTGSDER